MLQNDLILDFNLYLCEKFGYKNSCSVMQNANGFCVDIHERDLDCADHSTGCHFRNTR